MLEEVLLLIALLTPLPMNNIPITIVYQGMLLKGYADPVQSLQDATPSSLLIYIQGWCIGTLSFSDERWSMDKPIDPAFIEELGAYIYSYMQSIKKSMRYQPT
jgi:hypothetical protein